jgi:hypothetical protein
VHVADRLPVSGVATAALRVSTNPRQVHATVSCRASALPRPTMTDCRSTTFARMRLCIFLTSLFASGRPFFTCSTLTVFLQTLSLAKVSLQNVLAMNSRVTPSAQSTACRCPHELDTLYRGHTTHLIFGPMDCTRSCASMRPRHRCVDARHRLH